MTTIGGKNGKAGTYWHLMSGERVDLPQDGVLPGGRDDRYIKAPAFLAVATGPLLGLLFAVFLPFIGIVLAIGLALRPVAQGLAGAAASSMTFGWRPVESYLAGKKRREAARGKQRDGEAGNG